MTGRRRIPPRRPVRVVPEALPGDRPSAEAMEGLRLRLGSLPTETAAVPPVEPFPPSDRGANMQRAINIMREQTHVQVTGEEVAKMGRHDQAPRALGDTANGFYGPLVDRTAETAPTPPPALPEHVRWILGAIPTWSARFTEKSLDYGDAVNVLGARGQFADMHRKMGKLKRAMWDGENLTGEQPVEIVEDMIGHCFLTLYFLTTGADLSADDR